MFLQQKPIVKARPNQAIVVALEGRATMKSYLNDKEEPLVLGKPLLPFDQVRCIAGVLTISEFGKTVRIKPSPAWYTITSPNPAFRKYSPFPPDGAARALDAQIFDYPQSGLVVPNLFHLRWKPFVAQSGRPVQVRVRAGNDILWPPKNKKAFLPRDKTDWTPIDLQAVLIQKQNLRDNFSNPKSGSSLQLQWTDEANFPFSEEMPPAKFFQIRGGLEFRLLDAEKNKELKAVLQETKSNFDSPTAALYQAQWFDENELVGDAADAYETAARLAPDRSDVKDVALDYLRLQGLGERARQLERALPR